MPRWEPEQTVTQSIVERLIDLEPISGVESPPTRAQSLRQLKAGLRRDLEWLLNTRRTPDPAGDEYRETSKSLFNYGLPDITSVNWENERDRGRLARFHRGRGPHLRAQNRPPQGGAYQDRFRVAARPAVSDRGPARDGPAPEHVSFDTVLQLTAASTRSRESPVRDDSSCTTSGN